MRIYGDSIYLREIQLEDAEGNYPNWFNDPIVCKYNSHGDVYYTKKMAMEYISFVNNSPAYKVFAICDIKTDQHFGNASLQQISQKNKSAEFAIIIGENYFTGKRLSNESAEILLSYAFNELNLHRIYCGTSIDNIPMQKLAIFLGMKQEGVQIDAMFKNGIFINTIHYAIINPNL